MDVVIIPPDPKDKLTKLASSLQATLGEACPTGMYATIFGPPVLGRDQP